MIPAKSLVYRNKSACRRYSPVHPVEYIATTILGTVSTHIAVVLIMNKERIIKKLKC